MNFNDKARCLWRIDSRPTTLRIQRLLPGPIERISGPISPTANCAAKWDGGQATWR